MEHKFTDNLTKISYGEFERMHFSEPLKDILPNEKNRLLSLGTFVVKQPITIFIGFNLHKTHSTKQNRFISIDMYNYCPSNGLYRCNHLPCDNCNKKVNDLIKYLVKIKNNIIDVHFVNNKQQHVSYNLTNINKQLNKNKQFYKTFLLIIHNILHKIDKNVVNLICEYIMGEKLKMYT